MVVIQIRNEANPTTKKVKVSWLSTPKLSGPPRQIIPKNKVAQRTIIVKNNLRVIYCIFFIVSAGGVAPPTLGL